MGLAKVKKLRRYTPEEYLEFERESEVRHQFIGGRVYAMAGESLSHSCVCVNLGGEVRAKLKGKSCEALSPNMKVRTETASLFSYPDLTIVCGEPQFHDTKKDVLINPKVIFEVLSLSTADYDRTTKFLVYRTGCETLTDYVLISQDAVFIEHFTKRTEDEWIYRSYSELDDVFIIENADCELSVREIYDRVEFEDAAEPNSDEQ